MTMVYFVSRTELSYFLTNILEFVFCFGKTFLVLQMQTTLSPTFPLFSKLLAQRHPFNCFTNPKEVYMRRHMIGWKVRTVSLTVTT